jgi:hypothetical protein
MSKRSQDDIEPLGPRNAKRKAMDAMAEEKKKGDVSAEKRQVNKKLRADVDDLAGMFGKMSSSDQAPAAMDMDGQGRRHRKTKRRKTKKTRKATKRR